MKNTAKLHGFIALMAIVAFFTLGCDTGGGGTGGGGTGFLGGGDGEPVEFDGLQVYLDSSNYNSNPPNISTEVFTGTLSISSSSDNAYSGAAITNGKLSYTLKTPSSLPFDIDDLEDMFDVYTNLHVSNTNAKSYQLDYFTISGSYEYDRLYKKNYKQSGNGTTSYSQTNERVVYVYVDSDVTVTGTGKTQTVKNAYPTSGYNVTVTYTIKNLNLAFKKGWNAVYYKYENSQNLSGTTGTVISTESYTLSDPSSCKWVLD